MAPDERAEILAASVGERGNRRHKPGRAWERTQYRFDVLCDYGAFRDLQRHRPLTLEWQRLTPAFGYDVPAAIDEAGLRDGLGARDASARARRYDAIAAAGLPDVAQYAVSMAYRIRFVMQMTAREAMHLTELRSQPAGSPRLPRGRAGDAPRRSRRVHPAIAAAFTHISYEDVDLERLEAERRTERKRTGRTRATTGPTCGSDPDGDATAAPTSARRARRRSSTGRDEVACRARAIRRRRRGRSRRQFVAPCGLALLAGALARAVDAAASAVARGATVSPRGRAACASSPRSPGRAVRWTRLITRFPWVSLVVPSVPRRTAPTVALACVAGIGGLPAGARVSISSRVTACCCARGRGHDRAARGRSRGVPRLGATRGESRRRSSAMASRRRRSHRAATIARRRFSRRARGRTVAAHGRTRSTRAAPAVTSVIDDRSTSSRGWAADVVDDLGRPGAPRERLVARRPRTATATARGGALVGSRRARLAGLLDPSRRLDHPRDGADPRRWARPGRRIAWTATVVIVLLHVPGAGSTLDRASRARGLTAVVLANAYVGPPRRSCRPDRRDGRRRRPSRSGGPRVSVPWHPPMDRDATFLLSLVTFAVAAFTVGICGWVAVVATAARPPRRTSRRRRGVVMLDAPRPARAGRAARAHRSSRSTPPPPRPSARSCSASSSRATRC